MKTAEEVCQMMTNISKSMTELESVVQENELTSQVESLVRVTGGLKLVVSGQRSRDIAVGL